MATPSPSISNPAPDRALDLTVTLHRPIYEDMPTPQQAYVLFEAMPTANAPAASQPVNFSLVLDRSGSMAGEKLQQLKAAANWVVDHLGVSDILSVVIFDEIADVVVPAGPVDDPIALMQRISKIEERGGTHMSSGMHAGLGELQRNQATGRVCRMLLLTDGQTLEDQTNCEGLADQCRAAGIPINVMGLGVGEQGNWDPRFLESLAQRSGGEWTIIDTPENASSAFANILQEMQGAAVTNASLTIRYVAGLEPRAVWRVVPLIGRLSHSAVGERDIQVFLGDIQHKVGQSLLAEVLLPVRQPGAFRLMQADIAYDIPASSPGNVLHRAGHQVSVDVIFPFTADPQQAQQADSRLLNMLERVVAHKLQTQALDEAAAGDVKRATVRLRAAATRLLDLGEADMAEQALQQAQQMEQGGQIDAAAAQQMRYATKKLADST